MERPSSKALLTTGIAMQLGFAIALPLIFFIAVGIWLDKKYGLAPLFTLVGIIVSLAVSIMQIFRIIKSTQEQNNSNVKPRSPDRPGDTASGTF